MWILVLTALGLMTLAWLVLRWRPNYQRMLRRNPEKAVEYAQQLINEERYGRRDGRPPADPLSPCAGQSLGFGNPH